MSGDNLAILLFAWALAVTFFLEGRKEKDLRRWLFWGLASFFLVAGPFWAKIAPIWPQGEDFGKRVATDPTAWFILFMAGMMWLTWSGKRQAQAPTVFPAEVTAPPKPNIDWNAWKQMPKYTVGEFAAILAQDDPIQMKRSSKAATYVRLLLLDIETNKLPYIPRFGENYMYDTYELDVSDLTEIMRENALTWARLHDLPVTHIE